MKIPHFYCFSSRLGIIYPPFKTNDSNYGVAKGCEAIVTTSFINNFPGANLHKLQFASQVIADKSNYYQEIERQYEAASFLIKSTLDKQNEIQVVIGGDHGVSFPALGSVLERNNPNDVGVIMFDSHTDLCLRSNSPSGNFHGMWARPFIDNFDIEMLNQKIPLKIPSRNWMYIGDLEGWPYFDERELNYIKEKEIVYLSKKILAEQFNTAKNIFDDFLNRCKNIYVTFDIDVYTEDIAPATGITGKWGLDNNFIPVFLETIAKSGKLIGADLTEVNPEKEGAEKTIATAQSVLLKLLI